jgi:hypothetical protein
MKTLVIIMATLLVAYALAFGATLLIGHLSGLYPLLLLVGIGAVALTLWLLRSELPFRSR